MKLVFLDQSGQLGGGQLMLLDVVKNIPSSVILFEEGPFSKVLTESEIACEVIPLGKQAGKITKQAGLGAVLRGLPEVLRQVRLLVRRLRDADIVCANTAKALVIGSIACLIARKPFVYWLHDLLTPEHFSRGQLFLLTGLTRLGARKVIANSGATGRALSKCGYDEKNIVVIPNGFDLSRFEKLDPLPGTKLRERLGINDAPIAVMAGRFTPWKGQDVFIRALASVPGVHGWLIGDALFTEEDRTFAAGLPELALSLGCADRVHFLGFRHDVPELFSVCQLVVHASTKAEPFGRVIVEGMLAGCAVIATAEGGAAEILDHERTGLLVSANDDQALSEAMHNLITRPDWARQIGKEAASTARSRYSLPQIVEEMKAALASTTSS